MSESDQLLVLSSDVDSITVLGDGVGSFYWKFPSLEELFSFCILSCISYFLNENIPTLNCSQ